MSSSKRKCLTEDEPETSKRRRSTSLNSSDIELVMLASLTSPKITSSTIRRFKSNVEGHNVPSTTSVVGHQSTTSILDLPREILAEIFCSMPLIGLIRNCRLVCRQFNEIISEPKFLHWKKLYHRYLHNDEEIIQDVSCMFRDLLYNDSHAFEQLIRSMAHAEPRIDRGRDIAFNRLRRHSLFDSAIEIVKKTMNTNQGASNTGNLAIEEINLGALVATLVMISDGVESLSYLIRLLTAQPTYCDTIYWVEYFYRLLTILYFYSNSDVLQDGRRHYQLHYAVYLFENDGDNAFRISKASSSITPTYEQSQIIKYNLRPVDYMRIVAFAGTGKTSTLREYCRIRQHMRFLVVCFNRSVADEAVRSFPDNAVCRTIHQVAYGKQGHKYGDIKGKLQCDLQLETILKETTEIKGIARYVRAEVIRQTLDNYFASDMEYITTLCVPKTCRVKVPQEDVYVKQPIDFDIRLRIVDQAISVWKAMQDRRRPDVEMTHDGYLKIYQLSKPIITGYNAILVDEAQDCNPAMLDIIKLQNHVPRILVGDGYQQIYSFRGAVNSLVTIPFTKTFYLTQSFRFGPEIAYVANAWMRSLLGEQRKFLVGTARPAKLDGSIEGQIGVICRTNCTVFDECVDIALREQPRRCLSIGYESKPFNFEPLKALFYLYLSQKSQEAIMDKPKHYYTKMFRTLEEAECHAFTTNDKDLMGRINIVKKHKLETGNRIALIKACLVLNPKEAKYVVTTVHKAKGLEFDTVRLANDFADLDNPDIPHEEDDPNIIYVAMTRAKNSLILNETIYRMLVRRIGSLFHHISISKSDDNILCSQCQQATRKFLAHRPLALTYGNEANTVSHLEKIQICKNCVSNYTFYDDDDDEEASQPPSYYYNFFRNGNSAQACVEMKASSTKLSSFHFYLPLLE